MPGSTRCGQQHDRFISLVLRALQFAASVVALALVGGGFKASTVSLVDGDGATQQITVYYGGPTVNFAVVVTFGACLYDLFFLLLVYTLRCASISPPWSFGVDAAFTMLFMSAGCALAASDYVRYCDLLDDSVHCELVASGAALCFMAFVGFLLSVAWGAWMRNTWIKPRKKNPLGQTGSGQTPDPVLGDDLDDMERATTTYESNSYVHDGFVRT
ncbi:hypothetical protein BBJ28_00015695 [Nothophytophthora sp. Chile5]|nr:hypothetical protein BBJ28_00015695 [Nothophytophthora sp. Chile5]